MYIIINKKKRMELQSYIDELLQQGWVEVKDFYPSNSKIEKKSYVIKLQKI